MYKGMKMPEEHRKKISDALKEYYNNHTHWIKGLTKETDERIKKMSESLFGKRKSTEHRKHIAAAKMGSKNPMYQIGKNHPMFGKVHTFESCLKMSRSRIGMRHSKERNRKISKALKGHKFWGINVWKNGVPKEVREKISKSLIGHAPTYPKPFFVDELGHSVRSQYEKEIGLMLKKNEISYEYESRAFRFDGTSYRPDFIVNGNIIVEAKGYFSEKQKQRYREFHKLYPEFFFIIVGPKKNAYSPDVCDLWIPWDNRNNLLEVIK